MFFLWFSKKLVVGFQTWTCWSFSWNDLALVGQYLLNISLFWKQRFVVYLKCGVRLKSVWSLSCTIVFNFWKTIVVGFQPWTWWSFLWTDLSLVALYIIEIYRIWQLSSVVYLNFGVRFKSVLCHHVQFSKNSMWGSNPEQYNNFHELIYP